MDSIEPTIGPKFSDINEAKFLAEQQYEYYQNLSQCNNFLQIKDASDITKILHSNEYMFSILPIVEGLDFVGDMMDLQQWLNRGIKIIGPVWQKNRFGGCSALGGGLTEKGNLLLSVLQKNNVAIDIAHMSYECANAVLDTYSGIVVNTHTTCRHFVDDERLISDDHILKIHEHNGVIGLMTWKEKIKKRMAIGIDDYIDHICHIASVTGNTDSIAIGSSMNGGYGLSSLPKEMDSIRDLDLLYDALTKRSFSSKEIESILYKNWERVLLALY